MITTRAATDRFGVALAARDAACSVDGVVGLDAGLLGEISTYAAGRKVPGVRVLSTEPIHVLLRLVVTYRDSLAPRLNQVRVAVLRALPPGARVDLQVTDVHAP